ncbi:Pycsar system effector family protein [Kribbella jiaozuonensis]|uniref:Pycsar effector protein domain-containing protein n=1 Tax=Kribbella jiaozuonensis TaxID=2575441 RepID=A0A4U3LT30_9ACTN|nr:Pycsar system effector family protein [Kribbella jiaozuonensis]TKK79161.1 hypothetical protein FDA38_12070 [Kribbella jiaozuonensis]TKK83231.1 hypothetical protein FDA38_11025 [Kribbella jiaozuonensis]
MNESTAVDLAWRMHDSAAGAIDRADTKAGFAATVETAAAAVVLSLVSQAHGSPLVVRVLFGLSLIALAVALAAAMLVVTPRLHYAGYELSPGEFLYFGAVRLRSVKELRCHIDPTVYGGLVAEPWEAISHQAKRLAEIAWAKHRLARVSFLAAAVGVAISAVAVLVGGALR